MIFPLKLLKKNSTYHAAKMLTYLVMNYVRCNIDQYKDNSSNLLKAYSKIINISNIIIYKKVNIHNIIDTTHIHINSKHFQDTINNQLNLEHRTNL